MNDSTITLKAVDELRLDDSDQPQRYWIASYQRGYRWSSLQVQQLLEDIRDFAKRKNPQPDDFYCLQPLVLKQLEDGRYEVVDGQQRLTTLFLTLRYFNARLTEEFREPLFSLEYETRPNLVAFLDAPMEELINSNVDFFHLWEAVQTIRDWFKARSSEVETIKSALLNQTKVIWFELSERDNAVEAFTRLNVGKIPLTNDELIRALFLKRADAKEYEATSQQISIAHEWDQLEKALQVDAFWYFLSNESVPGQNRISFLFELVAQSEGMLTGPQPDANAIFYAYSKKLNEVGTKAELEWLKIKQAFMTVEEWYDDRNLYHIVGFLIYQGVGVVELRRLAEQNSKQVFAQRLKEKVWRAIFAQGDPAKLSREEVDEKIGETLDKLEYGKNSGRIRSILLLFNLVTLLENSRSNIRFQFDSFKSERWDIEHVRSVASDRPDRYDDRRSWLKHCLAYLESQNIEDNLRSEITSFLRLSQNDAVDSIFEPLYNALLKAFDETDETEADNTISNLTLLDANTNRSYKNAVFAVKRQRILDLDKSGIFVPLCTRNIFLKCYSPQVANVMFWSQDDRKAYRQVLVETLRGFFLADQGALS